MTATLRKILIGSSLAILVATAAGCSAPEVSGDNPPPSAPNQPPPPPPQPRFDTAPPAAPAETPLLGGPDDHAAPPEVVSSTPVPNPDDLSPSDRARIYGGRHGRHHRAHTARHSHRHAEPAHRHPGAHATAGSHRPAPHRAPLTGRHKAIPAPVEGSLYKPLPHPTQPAPAATPRPAPVAKPATATPAPGGKLDQLGGALNAGAVSAAKLNVSPEVLAGKPGVVSLVLPASLANDLATQAGKLGLSHAAKIADASATLTGPGYAILPDGVQTARLKPGEAATFNWQVTPSAAAQGGLAASIGANLKGAGKPQSLAIGKVAAPATPPAAAQGGQIVGGGSMVDKLAVPGSPTVVVPGVGQVKSGLLVLLFVGLLIAVLAIALYNRAQNEQRAAERRRREKLRDEQEERDREAAAAADAQAEPKPPETV